MFPVPRECYFKLFIAKKAQAFMLLRHCYIATFATVTFATATLLLTFASSATLSLLLLPARSAYITSSLIAHRSIRSTLHNVYKTV